MFLEITLKILLILIVWIIVTLPVAIMIGKFLKNSNYEINDDEYNNQRPK